MIVRLHGFDWDTYAERIMPAFKQWLGDGNESSLYQLYTETRCAREEQFLPPAMLPLCTWTRAQTLVKQLPQGSQTRHAYQLLCSATDFTEVSDLYVHRHAPRLYQNADTLRAIWGALVEEYCLVPLGFSDAQEPATKPSGQFMDETKQADFIALLHSVNLNTLALEVKNHTVQSPPDLLSTDNYTELAGVEIGRQPTTLHLRGWLAGISVRAMALFELLACGRRSMPFGYRSGEPYENYIGYLTPAETSQLATCLQHVQPPDPIQARQDYALFRLHRQSMRDIRTIDEVLPEHASIFLQIIKLAAQYDLGLLCSI
ncbi:hypothetical protein KDA_33470 [Dictyobacter alpinus]|uniref:Uncharacterized protein n=1 Tax=Dictyobacter alpinus TaxID=2014873 RepID=A0A402B8Y3_9CHLR|nr:hypothetical protein [Dictyobacter alpinus]GCE27863.1 hypothetical protein KDA_33470 [Dictyobacter alpinus]